MMTTNIHISNILESRRMDVAYYKDNLEKNNFVPLSKYVDIKGGKRIPKGRTFAFEKTDFLYLRLSEVNVTEHVNFDALKNISEDLYNTLKRYEIREGQIVFSIAGTIGKVFVMRNIPADKRVILTENCAMLTPKEDNILPEYISILLNCDFVQKQIEQNRVQTTIPKIGLERIANLKIPIIPPLNLQQEIVDIYKNAEIRKMREFCEAKQLLNSIDTFLANIMNVNVKNVDEKRNKHIMRNISSIIGGRLDVSSYLEKFEMLSTKYDNVKLSTVVEVNPSLSFMKLAPETPISFVPMECIDEIFGEISELQTTTISQINGYTKFEENDLLWAKITPCMQNGKSAIARHLRNGIGCGSTEFYVLRPKNDNVIIDYIYLILRHHGVLNAAQKSFGGSAGQQRVSSQYLKSIVIPLPNLSIQKEVVSTAYEMKNRAKLLQQEGNALLESAKQKIEQLILKQQW